MNTKKMSDGLKSYLYDLKINVNNELIEIDLEKELSIDGSDVEQSLMKMPITLGTLGIIYSKLKEQIADVRIQYGIRKAVLADKAIDQGMKVKSLIDDMCGDDEELVELQQRMNELNCYIGIVFNAIEALKTKSYILQNMYKMEIKSNELD